jgi:hypothetical protein
MDNLSTLTSPCFDCEDTCREFWVNSEIQTQYTTLSCFGAEITNGMLKIMAKHLKTKLPNLKQIDLRHNLLTDWCFEALQLLVSNCPGLKTIFLISNHVSCEQFVFEMKEMAQVLDKCIFIPANIIHVKDANKLFGDNVVHLHMKYYTSRDKYLLPSERLPN